MFNYTTDDILDCLLEVDETIQGPSRRSIELNPSQGDGPAIASDLASSRRERR